MHDRDVAGEQIGELRQEQGRAQVAHQPFVEKSFRTGRPWHAWPGWRASTAWSRSPPPAATIMSMRASRSALPFTPASVERKPGRVGADPLPGFHLALVALLRDLPVEIERRERMDEIGSEGLGIRVAAAVGEACPMRLARLRRGRRRCRRR